MRYEVFVEKMREAVQDAMGEKIIVEKKVTSKNNSVSVAGLTIADETGEVLSFMDLNSYYLLYLQEGNLSACVEKITEEYEKRRTERGNVQEIMRKMSKWEEACNRLYPILVSYEENKEWLTGVVHQKYLDLAICFVIRVPEVHGHVKVRSNLFLVWEITEERLMAQAMENLKQDGYTISSIVDMLDELGEDPYEEELGEEMKDEIPLRVLSNGECCFGAAGILYTDLLAEYAAKVEKNLFLLPSSVHEMMILPMDNILMGRELKAMVQEINRESVSPEERLSDHIYYFDRADETVRIIA